MILNIKLFNKMMIHKAKESGKLHTRKACNLCWYCAAYLAYTNKNTAQLHTQISQHDFVI